MYRHNQCVISALLVCLLSFLAEHAIAQPPAQSDVEPEEVREAWERFDYGSGPDRLLHIPRLEDREIYLYGWMQYGLGANNWGAPFNGPVTMADRSWQGQLNQLYIVLERETDGTDGVDLGGRLDLLFGTDYFYTTALGLDAYPLQPLGIENIASWGFSKDYGFALPQMYADVAYEGMTLRFGHFYSILGFEQVPAPGNFFYTHCLTMQFSPFTFTGFLGLWQPNEQITFLSGITTGWNNFFDNQPMIGAFAIHNNNYPGAGSTASYLGGVEFESSDKRQNLAITTTIGNEVTTISRNPADGSLVGNRSLISTVYTNRLSSRLTWVFQNDNAWQFNANVNPGNAGQQPGTAQWYSFVNYLFWEFTPKWQGAVRLEYFRDNNGYIVSAPLRNESELDNPGYWTEGFAGSFWELTLGLNWYPNDNWLIRPEIRYDWFSPNSSTTPLPYGRPLGQGINVSGDQYGQFYAGCDAVFQF
ncbi:MAG: outer membrane beta-barrel protein [Pirellulales bacterium]